MTDSCNESERLRAPRIFLFDLSDLCGYPHTQNFFGWSKVEFGLSLTVHLIGGWFGALRSQIGTVVYVRSHNFFISEAISMVLSVLERRDTMLSNAPKIIEIGWESTKLWSQTYATVQNLMIQARTRNLDSDDIVAGDHFCSSKQLFGSLISFIWQTTLF